MNASAFRSLCSLRPVHLLLMMPTLMAILLTLMTTGADAIWMPDDSAPVAPASALAPDVMTLQATSLRGHPGPSRYPGRMEGSGRVGDAEEENEEDYDDEEKWEEEGHDQWLGGLQSEFGQLDENVADNVDETRNAWDPREESKDPVAPEQSENGETPGDIFFSEDTETVPDQPPRMESHVVKSGSSDTSVPESDSAKVDRGSDHNIHGEPETTNVGISRSISDAAPASPTSLASTSSSKSTTDGVDDSSLKSITGNSQTGQASTTSTGAALHLGEDEHPPKSPFPHSLAADAEGNADPDAVAHDVNSNDADSKLAIAADAAPIPFTTQSSKTSTTAAPTVGATTTTASTTVEAASTMAAITKTSAGSGSVIDSDSNSDFESPDESSAIPSTATTSTPPPGCLLECRSHLDSLHIQVTPTTLLTLPGASISVECRLTELKGSDPQVKLGWRFQPENGSEPCFLGPASIQDEVETCTDTIVEIEEDFSNQTAALLRLTIPKATPTDSGEYACAVTASCCEGTTHAQTTSRSEPVTVTIYTKPRYGAQLAAVSVMCLCLLTGILGSACFQRRRRRRKKRISGPGHEHYEPVRQLQLPQTEFGGHGYDIDYDDDDFDDGDDAFPSSVENGNVRVNPMAEVPLTPPEVMPPLPEVTSLMRESQFEFPRPPSDLMKRMSSNTGFD